VVRVLPDHVLDPIRWKTPKKIFVASVADPFHEKLTNEEIAIGYGVMAAAHWHVFQLFTKRAARMVEWYGWVTAAAADAGKTPADFCFSLAQHWVQKFGVDPSGRLKRRELENAAVAATWPLPNLWVGVSTEHQIAADERIPLLLEVPAAVHMVSCEPLLGPIALDGGGTQHENWLLKLTWVIAGCESGPRKRAAETDWFRSLRDQCAKANVAFWLKQAVLHDGEVSLGTGSKRKFGSLIERPYLDGVQHVAYPGTPTTDAAPQVLAAHVATSPLEPNNSVALPTKMLEAAVYLLDMIGTKRVPMRALERAVSRSGLAVEDITSAFRWLGVAKDAKGYFLPNQIALALLCPTHRGR
jgi:protein gp37